MSDWVCTNCKSINRGGATACYSCGGQREAVEGPSADEATAPIGSASSGPALAATAPAATPDGGAGFAALRLQGATAVGPSVAAPGAPGVGDATTVLEAPALAPESPVPAGPVTAQHLAGGIAAGVVAAVLASALWYAVVVLTNYQVGLVAIAVGFLVGQAVVIGAARRGSPVLVAASVVLTLLALSISEYLIVVHFVGQEFAAEGLAIEVLQPIDFMVGVVIESISADPLTLAFWAIALFQAFIIPWRALRAPTA